MLVLTHKVRTSRVTKVTTPFVVLLACMSSKCYCFGALGEVMYCWDANLWSRKAEFMRVVGDLSTLCHYEDA